MLEPICLIVLSSLSVVTALQTSGKAYEIFELAQQRWQSQQYPSSVDYLIHVETVRNSKFAERHYRARWNARTNALYVDAVSLEERRDPYKPPPGFDFSVLGIHVAHIGGPNEGTG